jgi:hypothetical protein
MEREAKNHERGIDILYTHTYLYIIQNKHNIKQGERERKKRERESGERGRAICM